MFASQSSVVHNHRHQYRQQQQQQQRFPDTYPEVQNFRFLFDSETAT